MIYSNHYLASLCYYFSLLSLTNSIRYFINTYLYFLLSTSCYKIPISTYKISTIKEEVNPDRGEQIKKLILPFKFTTN